MPACTPASSSCQTAHGHRLLAVSQRVARRLVHLSLLAVVLVVLAAGPAAAHTGLESSDPPAGTTVVESLSSVTLTFTAPIRLLDDSVVATAADGRRIEAFEEVGPEGLVLTAQFDEPLTDGTWELVWRVLATDSHPRTGAVELRVGTSRGPAPADESPAPSIAAPDAAGGDNPGRTTSPADPVEEVREPGRWLERAGDLARVFFYAGLLVAAGVTLFKAGPHAGQSVRARHLAGIALVASIVGLISGVAEVALHVAAVSGRGLRGAVHLSTWRAVLGTGLGPALLLRTLGLGLVAVGARRRVREDFASGPDLRKLVGALIAIVSFQFVGHTASAAPPIVVRSADLVHAVAAAIWVGGLVGLLVTAGRARAQDRALTVARFSNWATAAVAGVTVAGVALAWVNLPSVAASWQTVYGRLLLAKLVIVGALLLLGAHNHFNVVPDVVDGSDEAANDLRRVVRWEISLVGVVVVLTAFLVNTSPV